MRIPGSRFRHAYWKFTVTIALFALVSCAISSATFSAATPDTLRGLLNLNILVWIPVLAVTILLVIQLITEKIDIPKICLAAIVVLEFCAIAAAFIAPGNKIWFQASQIVLLVFQIFIWSIMFVVGGAHKTSAGYVVAIGFGMYFAGCGAGSMLGGLGTDVISSTVLGLILVVVLLPTFLTVGEKDFEAMLQADADESAPQTLEDALSTKVRTDKHRQKGSFTIKLEEYARIHELTARETEALRYLVAGRGDNQIAEAMGISYNTARTHVHNVYAKCAVHGRQELIDVVNDYVKD